jgi:hypothetical protein
VYEGLFLRIYFQGSVIRTFDEVARRRLLSFPSQFSLIDRKAGGWVVMQNGPTFGRHTALRGLHPKPTRRRMPATNGRAGRARQLGYKVI